MTSWLGRKLESAINFVNRASDFLGESSSFNFGRNIFRFLFGLPLGVTRLLVIDAPIHLGVFAAKVAHTTSFATLWKNIFDTKVDPFYQNLSDAAKAMTSNFVTGFMFGPYLETASWAKEKLAEMEAENFGNTKGDPKSPENLIAQNPKLFDNFFNKEMGRVDRPSSTTRTNSFASLSKNNSKQNQI